jgi:hypothetical protein
MAHRLEKIVAAATTSKGANAPKNRILPRGTKNLALAANVMMISAISETGRASLADHPLEPPNLISPERVGETGDENLDSPNRNSTLRNSVCG